MCERHHDDAERNRSEHEHANRKRDSFQTFYALTGIALFGIGFHAVIRHAHLLRKVRGLNVALAEAAIGAVLTGALLLSAPTRIFLNRFISQSFCFNARESDCRLDDALGNVVGSNIFNVLFILGLSALIVPLVVSSRLIRWDVPLMIVASVLLLLLGLDGRIVGWMACY